MAKEILLYSGIYSFTAEKFISQLEENKGKEVVVRIYSGGGDVFATWGMAAKIQEHGRVTIQVDGLAASSAANLLMYANDVHALDVSKHLFHRANMYVGNEEDQKFLDNVNSDLKKKMLKKFTADKFKEVTGYTLDDMFDPEKRVNVWLTSAQMKELGIVSKIKRVNPREMEAYEDIFMKVAAEYNEKAGGPAKPESKPDNPTNVNMTLEEIKEKHPALYASIVKAATELGAKAERTRISAWLSFVQVDAKAVVEGIKTGAEVDQAVIADMTVKMHSPEYLKKMTAEATPTVASGAAKEQTAEEKELSGFEASVNNILSFGKPAKVEAAAK